MNALAELKKIGIEPKLERDKIILTGLDGKPRLDVETALTLVRQRKPEIMAALQSPPEPGLPDEAAEAVQVVQVVQEAFPGAQLVSWTPWPDTSGWGQDYKQTALEILTAALLANPQMKSLTKDDLPDFDARSQDSAEPFEDFIRRVMAWGLEVLKKAGKLH